MNRTSESRRACQTVLAGILQGLLPALAPVLPHMAEDAWQHLPWSAPAESVFQASCLTLAAQAASGSSWPSVSVACRCTVCTDACDAASGAAAQGQGSTANMHDVLLQDGQGKARWTSQTLSPLGPDREACRSLAIFPTLQAGWQTPPPEWRSLPAEEADTFRSLLAIRAEVNQVGIWRKPSGLLIVTCQWLAHIS